MRTEQDIPPEDSSSNVESQPESAAKPSPTPEQVKTRSWFEVVRSGNDDEIKGAVSAEIAKILSKYSLDNYHVLLLYDAHGSITDFDANKIYDGIASESAQKSKDILLVLHSNGGSIEPAYLISKTLKHFALKKFIAVVPRRAKSAATLICLGADEIHMGLSSQLGPIDPQIDGLPALGLVNALDTLAELSSKHPKASDMIANYLASKLDLRILGYFNRITQSAAQYGQRLLASKKLPEGQTAQGLAEYLVNHYKDHSFVIDLDEATDLLGKDIVKSGSEEYKAMNEIFVFLDFFEFCLSNTRNKRFYYSGTIKSGMFIRPSPNKTS